MWFQGLSQGAQYRPGPWFPNCALRHPRVPQGNINHVCQRLWTTKSRQFTVLTLDYHTPFYVTVSLWRWFPSSCCDKKHEPFKNQYGTGMRMTVWRLGHKNCTVPKGLFSLPTLPKLKWKRKSEKRLPQDRGYWWRRWRWGPATMQWGSPGHTHVFL